MEKIMIYLIFGITLVNILVDAFPATIYQIHNDDSLIIRPLGYPYDDGYILLRQDVTPPHKERQRRQAPAQDNANPANVNLANTNAASSNSANSDLAPSEQRYRPVYRFQVSSESRRRVPSHYKPNIYTSFVGYQSPYNDGDYFPTVL